jgi:DNA-binding response OmpR family regulator
MRTKLLLLGSNAAFIDDFFHQMDDAFEVLCTSRRYDDILGHLKYFQPQALVYCLAQESRDDIVLMVSLKRKLTAANIPLVIIGDAADCTEFTKIAPNMADDILTKPLTAATIESKLSKFLRDWYAPKEDEGEQTQEEAEAPKEKQPSKKKAEPKEDPEQEYQMDSRVTDILAGLGIDESIGDKMFATTGEVLDSGRKHILIIDDDIRMLRMLKSHLEEDYEVATAISGDVGLRFLERRSTDLILLDYEMPGQNGPEVLEKLHANEETKDIPVLFLTGAAERDKIRKALSLKPQGYLLKPIDQKTLLGKVREIFMKQE